MRCEEVAPKRAVKARPRGVGSPDERDSKMPSWEKRVWMLVNALLRLDSGKVERAESSRCAHSITIRMPSISPSTLAKNLVSSIPSVLSDSERASSSETIIGAEVMFALRTDSPRSHTATPVSWRSPIWRTPFSE